MQDTQNVLDIPGDEAAAAVVHLLPLSKTGCHLVRGSALSSADLAARRWALASATGANTEEATAQLAEAVLAYFQLACTKVRKETDRAHPGCRVSRKVDCVECCCCGPSLSRD